MKLIEANADSGHIDTVAAISEKHEAADFRLGYKGEDGRQIMRILIADDRAQAVLDALQNALGVAAIGLVDDNVIAVSAAW